MSSREHPLVSSKAELKRTEKQKKKSKSGGFESLNLRPNVFRGVERKGYKVPTPIQHKTMPLVLAGCDVVAMACTGAGKTDVFLVPMLQRLNQHVPQGCVRALILSHTNDLALRTLKFTKELGRYTDLRISLLFGGDSMGSQFEELAQNPDIIIATPGRLMHHLSEVDDMSLKTVEYVVFDEADSLFGMAFGEQRSSKKVEMEVQSEMDSLKAKERKETCGSKRKSKSLKDEENYISSVPTNHLDSQ